MWIFRRLHGTTTDLRSKYFISHSYQDAEARERLIRALPTSMHPFIFPPIKVRPDKLVSNSLIKALMDCEGLIYLEGGASAHSFWVAFERDYALRMHKQVFAFEPATGTLRRDTSAPLDLKVFLSYAHHDAPQVRGIQTFMKDERFFDTWLDSDNLVTGQNWDGALQEGIRSRIEAGGYVVVFWSHQSAISAEVQHEITSAFQAGGRGHVLPVLLDGTSLSLAPEELASIHALQLYGDRRRSARQRIDDLIVGLYWLIYRNTHDDDLQDDDLQ